MAPEKAIYFKHKAPVTSHRFLISQLVLFALVSSLFGAVSNNTALPDAFNPEDLLSEIKLGTHQYTIPQIDKEQIFIGTDDRNLDHPAVKHTGGGIVMCMDRSTGQMIWQLP
ncbi:MAG: hypothetical protein E4H40_08730, partial [Candidatus Brocadiia bacterium]